MIHEPLKLDVISKYYTFIICRKLIFFYKPIITLNFTRVLYTLMARIYLNKTRIFTIFRDFLPLRHVNLTGHNLDISTQVL